MIYSLANYILTITKIISDAEVSSIQIGGALQTGNNGSMTDSMAINRPKETWSIKGDDTGGYVHEKSYNKTGTVSLTLNQLSRNVSKFISLCNIYARPDVDIEEGMTMTLTDSQGQIIATCTDCMPQGIPEQRYGASTETQTWNFNCGIIEFN